MSGSEHDAELEAFLKRRSPIHRRLADFDHAEPSIELDRLVLNRAREAIDSPAQPPMFRTARWAMPVGLAATILIAFTIILNIDQGKPRLEKTVAAAKPEQPAAPAARLTANRVEGAAADTRMLADSNVTPPSVAARAKPAAAANAEPGAARERQDALSEKKTTAPLLADTRSGYIPPSPQQRSADEPQVAASTAADAATAEAESDLSASQVEQRRRDGSSAQPLIASGSAVSAVTDRATATPAAASPPPAAPPAYQASAESWLREINRLRATGKTAEAERELTAFRQAYPSHPGYSLARPPTR
jgi:hypothetical protein